MTIILFLTICTCLLVLSFIDWRMFIVPYSLLLILTLLCLAWGWLFEFPFLNSLASATSLMLVMIILRYGIYLYKRQPGCGWGDVWLFGVCGLVVQLDQLTIFFLATGASGIVLGNLWKWRIQQQRFPFVPCISLGLTLALATQLLKGKLF